MIKFLQEYQWIIFGLGCVGAFLLTLGAYYKKRTLSANTFPSTMPENAPKVTEAQFNEIVKGCRLSDTNIAVLRHALGLPYDESVDDMSANVRRYFLNTAVMRLPPGVLDKYVQLEAYF